MVAREELAARRPSGGWRPQEYRENHSHHEQDAFATDRRHHRTVCHASPGGSRGCSLAQRRLPGAGLAGIADAAVYRDADAAGAVTVRFAVPIAKRKREAFATTEREPAQVADTVAESDDLSGRAKPRRSTVKIEPLPRIT